MDVHISVETKYILACTAGVLFGRANVVIWLAMFDLELDWTARVGGGRRASGWCLELNSTNQELRSWANRVCKITMICYMDNLHSPTHIPLLIIDRWPPPWYKFLSLPSLPLSLKSKRAAIIFIKKIMSTRSPKWRLLCKLNSVMIGSYLHQRG